MTLFDQETQGSGNVARPGSATRKVVGWFAFLAFAVAVVVGTYLPAPYVIERPGPAFNVLGQDNGSPVITISGAKTYDTDGALQLLTVSVLGSPKATPTWFELFLAWLDPAQAISPLDQIFPPNQTQDQVDSENLALFEDSTMQAGAVALRQLGYKYTKQVVVVQLQKGSPAVGVLKSGDTILAIDGKVIGGMTQLRQVLQSGQGKPIQLSILRDGKTVVLDYTPKKMEGDYRLGIFGSEHFQFPLKLDLKLKDVGGPSGGLMFSLGIYDKLTPGALTGGKIIAGTGTIDEAGNVGEIGGIREKLYSASRAGASWFLSPAANCAETVGHVPAGLTVFKVNNFQDALRSVQTIASGNGIDQLPLCESK
ncbi:MAG: PDZ domain-containing protein [Micrococcales bacterium]